VRGIFQRSSMRAQVRPASPAPTIRMCIVPL
jgi:hypothetical protein